MDLTLRFETPSHETQLPDATVFLSASIPDPTRWDGPSDPLEITDAVVALARVFLTAGATLVTAAHPTISPLLLYVAAELPDEYPRRIITYQSELFKDVLPEATRRFQAEKIGIFRWTPAIPGEQPIPGEWDGSLATMRHQMLTEAQPSAAIFVGGMEGITQEHDMFRELLPGAPTYRVGHPGGEARRVAERTESPLRDELLSSRVYPALWHDVLIDLARRR